MKKTARLLSLAPEDRFGIELVFVFGSEEKMCTDFKAIVLAGSDEYDLFMGHRLYSAKIFNTGVFADWNETGADFSKMMQNRGNLASYIKTWDKIVLRYYEQVAEVFFKN
ncbi:MAG: hypothetical protein GX057_01225 [Clostridiales bacterium]|nr:hypothetical protein [Clostridiales bacterium]